MKREKFTERVVIRLPRSARIAIAQVAFEQRVKEAHILREAIHQFLTGPGKPAEVGKKAA